ncbi:MAG: ABC transporter ATP-binding protein/permease [Actinomycetota bacterium]|nr:ABC transporter ATP-binding protein/permease [Actinomycetota bacterium]
MTTVDETPAIPTSVALRRTLREAPALRRGLGLTVLLAALGIAGQLVVPVVVQQLVDREILATGDVDVAGALRLGAAALAALAAAVAASRAAMLRLVSATAEGLAELRVKLFRHLHDLSILHVQSERRGALVARVTSDINTIQEFMEWGGVGILLGSAQVLLAVVAMAVYRWPLALLVVAGVVVYAGLMVWFQRILARAHDQVRQRVGDSLAVLGEAISGLPVVRAYGAEAATMERVRATLAAQVGAEYRTGKLGAFLFSSAELFAATITVAVVAAGVVFGAARGVSAGTLLAFLFLVNLLIDPIQMLVETLDNAQAAAAGVRRVLRVLDTRIDLPDPDQGVDLPAGGLDVAFRGVGFSYPTGPEVLSDISLQIPAGRRLAVVGETGSGKTTFAKLLCRLLDPSEGRIEVGGVPLDQVRFASLRQRVAFVPQEGFLFGGTLADNVRYGRPEASEREIEAAFLELGLDEWLERLPSGLQAPVGERGGQLSAGERQLVALVRAWMAVPDLLVLDEATSAVDPALEVQLRRAIERLTRGRTSVTIAHRLSTAEAADEVLVFDRGRLVERGHHRDLVAADGVYAHLHADWTTGSAVA